MPHILITDDQPLIFTALEMALKLHDPSLQIHQATHIDAAKTQIKRNPAIQLMLLDRLLSGIDSLQHLTTFWEIHPQLRIAIISGMESRESIAEVMKTGAAGFIPKSLPTETVITAIQELLAGKTYIPRDLLDNPYLQYTANETMLSFRHTAVLSLAATGQSNKQIAEKLKLTEGTVKQHFYAIFNILDAKNRTHAVQIARNRGFIC